MVDVWVHIDGIYFYKNIEKGNRTVNGYGARCLAQNHNYLQEIKQFTLGPKNPNTIQYSPKNTNTYYTNTIQNKYKQELFSPCFQRERASILCIPGF